jgi:hypothetical protein
MDELRKNVNISTQTIFNKSSNNIPYPYNKAYPNYNQINYGNFYNVFVFQVRYNPDPDHNQENEANEIIEQNVDPNLIPEALNPNPIPEINVAINNANNANNNENDLELDGFNIPEINAINNFARAVRDNNIENQPNEFEALRNAIDRLIEHLDELFNNLLNEHLIDHHINNGNNNENPNK